MTEANFALNESHPSKGRLERRLRLLRGLAARVAPRVDPIVLLVVVWTVGYLAFATTPIRRPDGHAAISDFWLMPTGMAIGLIGLLLAWDDRLDPRDQIPWRLMMVAGLLMPRSDGLWLFPRLGDPARAGDSGVGGGAGATPLAGCGCRSVPSVRERRASSADPGGRRRESGKR